MGVRKITNGGRKVVGKFPSIKMRKMIMWESQIERDYLYFAEFDPDVVSIQGQPVFVWYFTDDGKIHRYTPDFLVIKKPDKKQLVEIKDEKSAQSEEFQLLFKRVAPIMHHHGYEFLVVTDKVIRIEPLLSNLKLLHKYAKVKISNKHLIRLNALFSKERELSLREIVEWLDSKGISIQEVYALLRHGLLSVNLKLPINNETRVSYAHHFQNEITKEYEAS